MGMTLATTSRGTIPRLRIATIGAVPRRATEWADHALRAVAAAGRRGGGARRAIVEFLGRQRCCVTAQEIFDGLRAEGRAVGIASVYRVLELLVELRLVQRLDVGNGTSHYEAVRPDGEHHHHLVCDDCGRVDAFEDDRLERALSSVAGRVAYDVGGHEVVLRGACGDCRTVAATA